MSIATEAGPCFVGVDVGTGSARAAIVNAQGDILGFHVHPIKTWNPRHEIYQQSSDEIWSSICIAVCSALAASGVHASSVRGIGFDATCSLVVLDPDFAPLSVDPDSAYATNDQNIILWADHRAADQAARINATNHPVLRYVGDVISLEMEVPKILWLKENMPAAHWKRAAHFFDLPDFLTFRATGSLARSRCSLTCKCSFVPLEIEGSGGWNDEFFSAIGLGEFVEERYKRVGGVPNENGKVLFAGDVVGNGLSKLAAEEMGLMEGTPVGSAVIDAYAGAIATLGTGSVEEIKQDASGANRLAIICGTSSCHITMSPKPIFVPGVWGPYLSVLVPGMWCAEGGQSSAGRLIDHILATHPSITTAHTQAAANNTDIYAFLNARLATLRETRSLRSLEFLTKHLHIYPDFHGNRSPLADSTLRGAVSGLSLDVSVDDLALRYYATLQSIACQTRHIIESLNGQGYTIDTLYLSGGLCCNPLFLSLHADITRCRVVLPKNIEGAVVLGAAFLGAKASAAVVGTKGEENGLWEVMVRMGQAGEVIEPTEVPEIVEMNERRYRVFREMLEDQRKYRAIMDGTP